MRIDWNIVILVQFGILIFTFVFLPEVCKPYVSKNEIQVRFLKK